MKIRVRFKHHFKGEQPNISVAFQHLDTECSAAQVLKRAEPADFEIEIKPGDILEFATTRFVDEFDFFQHRRGRILNMKEQPKAGRHKNK